MLPTLPGANRTSGLSREAIDALSDAGIHLVFDPDKQFVERDLAPERRLQLPAISLIGDSVADEGVEWHRLPRVLDLFQDHPLALLLEICLLRHEIGQRV